MPTSTDKGVSRSFTRPSGFTKLMRPFITARLDDGETEVLQGVGLWLPGGPEDYAIPDLSVVDADLDEHVIENNCYDPAVFRLLLEVTSSNYNNDLRAKVGYDSHQVYAPGRQVTLPASIGAEVTLDVADLLKAGQHRK
ncbi:Uma2 family endonuclease [Streptomyces sp. NPDC001937]